jgi:dTDP-4-amino-4,6-dideoxygalactose transaminase
LAAGIGPGDEVITSPNTFVASANCVVYCGAKPVFADIDPDTYNISSKEIEKKITGRTKAIIPVHFAGQSCDMQAIREIVEASEEKYGHKIAVIEDACHALGSLFKGQKVGSCAFSDMTVMSFHPVKHITTGEGGVVLTHDDKLYRKLKRFRSHGITSDSKDFINRDMAFPIRQLPSTSHRAPNHWYYEQQELGFNYRVTDIQCALGLSQLTKLDMFRRRRREIVDNYNSAFSNIAHVQTPHESPDCDSNFHLYVLQFDFEKMGIDRDQCIRELKAAGIQAQVHYIPVHLQPFYRRQYETKVGDCPAAEQYYKGCLSIPLYPEMTIENVEKVVATVKELARPRKSGRGASILKKAVIVVLPGKNGRGASMQKEGCQI